MSALLQGLRDRVTAGLNLLRNPSEAVAKELRQFPTHSTLYDDPSNSYPISPENYGIYPNTNDILQASDYFFFQSFADGNDMGPDRVLRVKVSRDTMVEPGVSVHDMVTAALRVPADSEPLSLKEFLEKFDPDLYARATERGIGDSAYFRELRDVLSSPTVDLPAAIRFRSRWPCGTHPTLCLKLYLSRCDERAYARDPNVMRALLGSIVHAFLVKTPVARRGDARFSSIWPAKGKNIVLSEVVIPTGSHYVSFGGDVSSFTSSFSNVWANLFKFAQAAECSEVEDFTTPFLIMVGDQFMETNILEVVRCYLYVAPFIENYDDYHGRFYTCVGGLLGVAGVNTLACISFAVLMRAISLHLGTRVLEFKVQLGGDDFRGHVVGELLLSLSLVNLLSKIVGKFVGRLKGMTAEPFLSRVSGHTVEVQTFCKKFVEIYAVFPDESSTILQVSSLMRLPLLNELYQKPLVPYRKERQAFENFSKQLVEVLRFVPDSDRWFRLYVDLWSSLRSSQSDVTWWPLGHQCPIQFRGLDVTPACQLKIDSMRPVSGQLGGFYVFSEKVKRSTFACSGDAILIKLDDASSILALKSEFNLFRCKHEYRFPAFHRLTSAGDCQLLVSDIKLLKEYVEKMLSTS